MVAGWLLGPGSAQSAAPIVVHPGRDPIGSFKEALSPNAHAVP